MQTNYSSDFKSRQKAYAHLVLNVTTRKEYECLDNIPRTNKQGKNTLERHIDSYRHIHHEGYVEHIRWLFMFIKLVQSDNIT